MSIADCLFLFNSRPKHFGITPPIATAFPNEREIEVTDLLVAELKKQGTFESEEESRMRYAYLFDGLVCQPIRS